MNQREKILAIAVGVVLAILVGNFLVNRVLLGPLNKANDRIAGVQKEIDGYNRQLKYQKQVLGDWTNASRQSLSDNPEKAPIALSERITMLISAAGLHANKQPVGVAPIKGGGDIWYYPIAINLSGKGTLAQIVKFLELFYMEPYNVKITSLTLQRSGGSNSDQLSFNNCRIETLVPGPPPVKAPAVEVRPVTHPVPTLSGPSRYARIPDRDIFQPKKTRLPVTPPNPNPPSPGARTGPGTIIADSSGRPGDVIGTTVIGDQMGAYIRNRSGIEWYKVEDALENGMKVVYVHPLGVVVKDPLGRILYVEIGSNLDQTAPLTADALPELYEAYQTHGAR